MDASRKTWAEEVEEQELNASAMPQRPGKNARKKAARKENNEPRPRPQNNTRSTRPQVNREIRPPQQLSTKQTTMSNDPFMGENVFTSEYGLGGGVQVHHRNYFTNHYGGYVDLVRATYRTMIGYDRKVQSSLPQCLFEYGCYTALWYRLLAIESENSNLSSRLQNELHRLDWIESIWLPVPIISYLRGVGNFTDPEGIKWYHKIPFPESEWSTEEKTGLLGHFGNTGTNTAKAARYLWAPIPYVYSHHIQCSYAANTSANFNPLWVTDIDPQDQDDSFEKHLTEDILGWTRLERWASSSTTGVLQGLGWNEAHGPSDLQSSLLCLSPSTISHFSERMSEIKSIKVAQLTSVMVHNPNGSTSQMTFGNVTSSRFSPSQLRLTKESTIQMNCKAQVAGKLWQAGFLCLYRYIWTYEAYDTNSTAFKGCGWWWKCKDVTGKKKKKVTTPGTSTDPPIEWYDCMQDLAEGPIAEGIRFWQVFESGSNLLEDHFIIYPTYRSEVLSSALEGCRNSR